MLSGDDKIDGFIIWVHPIGFIKLKVVLLPMMTPHSASDWIILILTHLLCHSWQLKTRKAERSGQFLRGENLGSPSLNPKILLAADAVILSLSYDRKCSKMQTSVLNVI